MSNTNTIESPCEEVLSITKNDLENFLMTRYWFVHRNQARRLCNFFDIDYSWLQTQWKKQGLTERGFRDTGKLRR